MFKNFSKAVHANFVEMAKGELYVVDIKNDMGELYLAAFPEGTDPIYRVRRTHDCQCCKHFVRRIGKVVAIRDNKLVSIWDNLDVPEPYKAVADKLSVIVRSQKITHIFRTKELKYGLDHNYDEHDVRHDHFYEVIPTRFHSASPNTLIGAANTTLSVLRRGLEELNLRNFQDVLDLIEENGLYRGEQFKPAISAFAALMAQYASCEDKDIFLWQNFSHKHAEFRNSAIGNLFVELAAGRDFEEAVKAYERTVAPINYQRPTKVITQSMVEKAVEKLTALGLHGAVQRRYARLSDISVNDVLFVDNESRVHMKDGITALLETAIVKEKPNLQHADPIIAGDFVRMVLPTAKTIDVLIENRHTGNFVSLTGGDGPERLFKWDNNFAWSYDGDVTDSVKQRVKAAGGNINTWLRVSLSWFNTDDLDLHAKSPNGNHIYFGNKSRILDVDMNAGIVVRNPVENLAFNSPQDGTYEIWVNQFRQRETTDTGFDIEIEIDGVVHRYNYRKAVKGDIQCFKIQILNHKLHKIETTLEGGNRSQDKWGVKTETLVPVAAIMHSPNHWNGQAIGAKHLIFALKGCVNPDNARGIYNEYLRDDLHEHRKVFEVLGAKTKCKPSVDQVSGVGFTAARNDSITAVVNGRRAYNVSF